MGKANSPPQIRYWGGLLPFRKTVQHADSGRGPQATADMKARIAALKAQGTPIDQIIEVLWERSHRAEAEGEGYVYEFVETSSTGQGSRF